VMKGTRLLLVGCGKMGGALLDGWLQKGITPDDVLVVDPVFDAYQCSSSEISVVRGVKDLPKDFEPDAIVFAVKPQIIEEVAPAYAFYKSTGTIFISIVAGKTIASFERLIGDDIQLARVMPNTPAAIGRGISVACGNANVSPQKKELCIQLFEAVGTSKWIEDEVLMDAVTGVSGSGPAYVFLLIEALAAAGISAGLDPGLAEELAKETVAGAGILACRSKETPAVLRENVTSPGGTTAAALAVLMGPGGVEAKIDEAVHAAVRRSQELAR
jgi:pyrroline-5-carboxylate reductase